MNALGRSRAIACTIFIFISVILSAMLLFSGFFVLGFIILCASAAAAVYSAILFLWDNKLTTKINDYARSNPAAGFSYKTYKLYSVYEWYKTHPHSIVNQTFAMLFLRFTFTTICLCAAVYEIITRSFDIFYSEPIFNMLMCALLIIYALIYFVLGTRYCAAPAFITFLALIATYLLHLLTHAWNLDPVWHDIFTSACAAIIFSTLCVLLYIRERNEIFYSNAQVYEKNSKFITIDLFLTAFTPMKGFDTLLTIEVISSSKGTELFIKLLHKLTLQTRRHEIVFIGFANIPGSRGVKFYIQTERGKDEAFIKKARILMQKHNYGITHIAHTHDPNWETYQELYPEHEDLCSIVSRSTIEDLLVEGIDLDIEYSLHFCMNFKNKSDPANIEEALQYFGFSLAYTSYEDDGIADDVYTYYGEYKIKSFITPRRIEYLNKLLLEKSMEYNALYLGEWHIGN